jgi:hypothetical protein
MMLAFLASALTLLATRHGVGASPDSVVYIGVARNLLAGRGLSEPFGAELDTPLTRYPPLYPFLLAAGDSAAIDPLRTARWLAALLAGANVLLAGLALRSLLPYACWLPLVASLLVLTGYPLLTMHAMAWSEPLFLLLGFSGLFSLAAYLDKGRTAALVGAGLLIGLAFLTRYAAIPFLAAGVLGLVGMSRRSSVRRLASAALFAALGALPTAFWALRNLAVADTAAARMLAWHPAGREHVWQALYTVAGWLHVPDSAPNWLRLGLLVAVAAATLAAVVLMWSSRLVRQVPAFVKLLMLLLPLYVAFLVASISLLDASTPLDDRILAPVYVAILLLVLYAVGELLPVAAHPRRWQVGLVGLLLLLVAGSLIRGTAWVGDGYRQGIGFESLAWQRSPLIEQVRALPPEVVIYSNAPEAIYLHAGRRALPLPKPMDATTEQANPAYVVELARMQGLLDQQAALLVYTRSLSRRSRPSEEDLRWQLALCPIVQSSDGAVYAGGRSC